LRNKDGSPTRIVEDKDADDSERLINEINVGAYCFKADWLWPELQKLRRSNNETGEIYLVDLVERASKTGQRVFTVETSDQNEALGVNTRVHLAQAEQALRQRIRERHMLAGVTMLDPATTYIDSDSALSEDVTLYPNTSILGKTTVGRETVIGPGAIIADSRIGVGCKIGQSTIEGSVIEDRVDIGPYCHIRPGSRIESGVRLGNYVEVKNSRIGRDTQSGHFSYIGDAEVGRGVNIGAGAITCNYDGKRKHRTIIGDNAFIGSDTMLIAPVRIGRGSRTGAGAVVTHDVAPGDTVIGVPARVMKPKK
jgi:bifunctional UDP-N-acetylglucosamine pyrophosphorylase/glucosamine-1-phosphate N-acetyltransferase